MKRAARAEVNAVDGDVEAEPGIGTGGTADMTGSCELTGFIERRSGGVCIVR